MRYSEASTEAAYFHLVREARDVGVIARFTVDGEPVSKARARFTGYGSTHRTYTPAKTMTAELAVQGAFRVAAPEHTPDAEATYGLTALFFNGTRQRRDVDNMLKLLLDGLNGVAWVDDNNVVEVSGRKCIELAEHARTEVVVYRVGMMQRLTQPCVHCGAHFETYPNGRKRYCGKACVYAARRLKDRPLCAVCGEVITGQRDQKTCSRQCMAIARTIPKPRCLQCGAVVSKPGVRLCRPCFLNPSRLNESETTA